MKTTIISSLLLSLFLLSGCLQKTLPLLDRSAVQAVPEEYEKYGAYYEFSELQIEQQFDEETGFLTTYTINRKLHILNEKGVDFGTLEIPHLSDRISDFTVKLTKDGKVQPLDIDSIKDKYDDSEKVVIPRVEPGSQISINITFVEEDSLTVYEHWFTENIPVVHGRFNFSWANEFDYLFRAYNTKSEVQKSFLGGNETILLEQHHILPEDRVSVSRNRYAKEHFTFDETPRILVSLEGFHIIGYNYYGYNWEQLARGYRDLFLATNHFFNSNQLGDLTKEITSEPQTQFQKADALLNYVQENISWARTRDDVEKPVDVHEVVKRKNGDYHEILVVLSELYKAAGFDVTYYATRSRNRGGFDPDFPSWSHLDQILVIVDIDGKKYAAYPFFKKMKLGEMRLSIHGLDALNLKTGEITKLPTPTSTENTFLSEVNVPSCDSAESLTWSFSVGGPISQKVRAVVDEYSTEKKKDQWERLLKEFSRDNLPDKQPETTLQRGENYVISGNFENDTFRFMKKDQCHTSFSPFFRKYFNTLESKRNHDYKNDRDLVIEERIRLAGNGDSLIFACDELDNDLFQTKCSRQKEGKGLLLRRVIKVKKARISADTIPLLKDDIAKLNRIGESHIIEKVK